MSIIIHLISVGSAPFWWGGGCYGPRLMTDSVPWFVLLAILGVKGMLNLRERLGLQNTSRGLRIQYVVGFFLLVVSMAINARGAISWHTGLWNRGSTLDEIDKEIARYWDWTDPQFLAGLLPPPLPKHFPLYSPGTRIDFGIKETEKYLWKGWSVPAVFFRWTNGHRAAIVFTLNDVNRSLLKIKFSPFLISGKLEKQRVSVKLNEQKIAEFEIKEPTEEIYVISLPKNILQDRNILSLDLPDAKAPSTLGVNTDPRVLGIAVQWFIIE